MCLCSCVINDLHHPPSNAILIYPFAPIIPQFKNSCVANLPVPFKNQGIFCWYDIVFINSNPCIMNPSIKPLADRSQTRTNFPFRTSFSVRLIKQICRFLQINGRENNTCFVEASAPFADGMKADPASLSTRTLLSSKRF